PRIVLGSATGEQGQTTVVPFYFTPREGIEVGRLKLTITFVSRNLKYSKVEPGIAAERENVDISAQTAEGQNEQGVETTTVTITASFLKSPPPDKGIPSGLLGYLSLNVNADARPAVINLRAAAEGEELKTNKPVTIEATNATVDLLEAGTEPPMICFIFSH
ncbi:MAG: hypothetical protein HY648_11205, partial [Acidobacteria bacterium]|nr:hypothetical protein [Acidobacteriota bacterium]